ncbi:MAG: APC family permease [Hyphomonadaceae bacterium]|nr:APC family permease [Hyphomonadaceae bacterium]
MDSPTKIKASKKRKDPMSWETWRHSALIAVLAWAGVGADSLSSANYGPEEAYKALHLSGHEPLVLWLALITALTVVVISLAYVQVIRLFPNGGGGYQAATRLVHPYAGLLSGSALVVDYALTIAISVAAASDAMFSLCPPDWIQYKPFALAGGLMFLLFLNLRGIRESVLVLAPIFFGFLLTHVVLIVFGLWAKRDELVSAVVNAESHVNSVTADGGTWALIAIIATAYAAGAGTYTGIEALSNNAHALKQPRAKTGAQAMALIAVSLAVVAGGIMLLYTAWLPTLEPGKTLNAVVFEDTLAQLFPDHELSRQIALGIAMTFAAALLLVAASSGFLGGPAVLASMAIDKWAPHSFAHLSNKLVAQNGVLTMGTAAGVLLLFTGGQVHSLVVLYSINVFLTFSLSLTGLTRYNLTHRREMKFGQWLSRTMIAGIALVVAVSILITLFVAKFSQGAWVAVVVALLLAACGFWVRDHYRRFDASMDKTFDELLMRDPAAAVEIPKAAKMKRPVGIVTGPHGGAGLHALMHAQRLFRGQFDSVIIISAGEVDAEAYGGHEALERLKNQVGERCAKIVAWSRDHGMPAKVYTGFSTDAVETLQELCLKAREDHPNVVFVATRPMTRPHGWASTLLHGGTALSLQRRLHGHDAPLIVLPMRVEIGPDRYFPKADDEASPLVTPGRTAPEPEDGAG